jgi:hypothetical protein
MRQLANSGDYPNELINIGERIPASDCPWQASVDMTDSTKNGISRRVGSGTLMRGVEGVYEVYRLENQEDVVNSGMKALGFRFPKPVTVEGLRASNL